MLWDPAAPASEMGAGSTAATLAAALAGKRFGLGTDRDTQTVPSRTPGAAWGSSPLTSSFALALVSFFSFAAFASFSVSRTSCLMNPPGMTDSSRGGVDGGGPRSSSRICLVEQRLGYGSWHGDRSPGKASATGMAAAQVHRNMELSTGALLCRAQTRRAGCR